MPTFDVEFEVWCTCGAGLCNQSETKRRSLSVHVQPCQDCLDEAFERGKEEGRTEAEKETERKGEQC